MTLEKLSNMLSHRMDTRGSEYDEYVSNYLKDMHSGKASSFYKIIGTQPKYLFVCKYTGYVKYTGKNDIYHQGNKIYLNTKNFRNSANNFTFIASTYVLLEMIQMKIPGIYLLLSKQYEKDRYVNGTELFPYEHDKEKLGYKVQNCDATIYLGNYGNEDLLYTSGGHRAASNEFVSAISTHFEVNPRLENIVDMGLGTGGALFDFKDFVPENIVLPCGVDHVNGAKNISDKNRHEFFADFSYIQKLIERLKKLPTTNFPINRIPPSSEFLGFELDEDQGAKEEQKQEKSNRENKGFWSWLKG